MPKTAPKGKAVCNGLPRGSPLFVSWKVWADFLREGFMRRFAFLTSLLLASVSASAQSTINHIDILGQWECNTTLSGLMHQSDDVTFYANQRFVAQGRFTSSFNFNTSKPEPVAYTIHTSGTWAIKNGELSTVDEVIELANANPKVKRDKFLDGLKKSMIPGEEESSTTKFIEQNIWLMQSGEANTLTLCTRKQSS